MTSTAGTRRIAILSIAALTLPTGSVLAQGVSSPAEADTQTLALADTKQPAASEPPAEPTPRVRRRPPRELPPPAPRLIVAKLEALPVAIHPNDPVWSTATSMEVALQPQTITSPSLETATVQTVLVSALTDGKQVAWRFSWADPHPATTSETGTFSDAVGVQFPLVSDAPYLMGAVDMPVHSLYWRAQWQQDIDHGFQDVQSTYPNAWSDLYWFANGHPYSVPGSFEDEQSHQWFSGLSAGNPMSDIDRMSPVEEITAEGFGTVTHVAGGIAKGRGVWHEGHWHVVMLRRITDDVLSGLFAPGTSSQFAVAVWDGDAGNVGGRKHHSLWVDFEVQR